MRIQTLLLLSALTIPACLDAEDATDLDETELATADQNVLGTSNTGMFSCTTTGTAEQSTCQIPLHIPADNDHLCYVAGVGGQLHSTDGDGGSVWFRTIWTWPGQMEWYLVIDTGWGRNRTVKAAATCIDKPGIFIHNTGAGWSSDTDGFVKKIPNATADMQCILDTFDAGHGFAQSTNNIRVFKSGSEWFIGGSQPLASSVGGSAICFVPESDRGSFSGSQVIGTHTFPLASNTGGGVACGLTSIGGAYTTVGDELTTGFDGSANRWILSMAGIQHSGEVRCYK